LNVPGACRDQYGMKKRTLRMTLAVAAIMAAGTLGATPGHSEEEEGIDKAQADALDARMFAGPLGKKAYACFVRRYDPDHLARHPLQKVRAMKFLVSAEVPPGETANYSFRLGFKYRHRSGDFDASGSCNHFVTDEEPKEMRFGCGVACDGGGINVAMSGDNKSAIVRLEQITVWRNNKPDDDAQDSLVAGADDKIFRLDRTVTSECASLVTDRKELAAMRHK
jgi:hypothetical protein